MFRFLPTTGSGLTDRQQRLKAHREHARQVAKAKHLRQLAKAKRQRQAARSGHAHEAAPSLAPQPEVVPAP